MACMLWKLSDNRKLTEVYETRTVILKTVRTAPGGFQMASDDFGTTQLPKNIMAH